MVRALPIVRSDRHAIETIEAKLPVWRRLGYDSAVTVRVPRFRPSSILPHKMARARRGPAQMRVVGTGGDAKQIGDFWVLGAKALPGHLVDKCRRKPLVLGQPPQSDVQISRNEKPRTPQRLPYGR